jgi:hypothetical protein
MRSWGIVLAVIGVSHWILPQLGLQHAIFRLFHPYELPAAVGLIVVGAVLFGLSFRKKPAKKT